MVIRMVVSEEEVKHGVLQETMEMVVAVDGMVEEADVILLALAAPAMSAPWTAGRPFREPSQTKYLSRQPPVVTRQGMRIAEMLVSPALRMIEFEQTILP